MSEPVPPSWFIDPAGGRVLLRLLPKHLERLHGPVPDDARWVDVAAGQRLPFALLSGSEPIDLVLRPGLTPADVAELPVAEFSRGTEFDGRYWFPLSAYARTPFGWFPYPTLSFKTEPGRPVHEARLGHVRVHRAGESDDESFDAMDAWLRGELGEPTAAAGDNKRRRHKRWRTWDFAWGRVLLHYEYRDRTAEVEVVWSR